MSRNETAKPIWIKFRMVVDIPDVIICTNLGDHRLRGFGWRGSNFPLSHRLSWSPLQHSHYRASVWLTAMAVVAVARRARSIAIKYLHRPTFPVWQNKIIKSSSNSIIMWSTRQTELRSLNTRYCICKLVMYSQRSLYFTQNIKNLFVTYQYRILHSFLCSRKVHINQPVEWQQHNSG